MAEGRQQPPLPVSACALQDDLPRYEPSIAVLNVRGLAGPGASPLDACVGARPHLAISSIVVFELRSALRRARGRSATCATHGRFYFGDWRGLADSSLRTPTRPAISARRWSARVPSGPFRSFAAQARRRGRAARDRKRVIRPGAALKVEDGRRPNQRRCRLLVGKCKLMLRGPLKVGPEKSISYLPIRTVEKS